MKIKCFEFTAMNEVLLKALKPLKKNMEQMANSLMTLPEVYSTALSVTMTIRVTMQAPGSETNQNGVNN